MCYLDNLALIKSCRSGHETCFDVFAYNCSIFSSFANMYIKAESDPQTFAQNRENGNLVTV